MDFLFMCSTPPCCLNFVAPRGDDFGENMVVRVACHFSDKCELLCCDLFFDVRYIEDFLTYCIICDALLFHFRHTGA